MPKNIELYKNLYGYWDVTTEGDCEGKSTRHLGTHKGWLDEVALHLADKCYYSLQFKKLNEADREDYIPKKKEVNVTLDIDSGTWDMQPDERVKYVQELFDKNERNIYVTRGTAYASFTIRTEQEDINEKRKKIISKLSNEEIELLGIKF